MVPSVVGAPGEHSLLRSTLSRVRAIDPAWVRRAEERQARLTKPEGSLGRLEEIANRVCAIQETLDPSVANPTILLFAADHGVVSEGVSAYPQSVTAQMVENFLKGGAAISALARANRIGLRVVDMGVASELPDSNGLTRRRIGPGTKNMAREQAMDPEAAVRAIETGIALVDDVVSEGCRVVGIGEMGIGNSTSASAIAVGLTGRAASEVVGRGTGVDDRTLGKKIHVVERAATFHRLTESDPIQILSRVGGFEIGAMCGVCLGGAAARTPVVIDGFIAASAAAIACRLMPEAGGYLFAAHRSSESGHAVLLDAMGQEPMLDLGMRLGEGTGAALGMTVMASAIAAFTEMATFGEAGVSERGAV